MPIEASFFRLDEEGNRFPIYVYDVTGNISHKRCSDCKNYKHVDDFGKSKKLLTGISTKCKLCKGIVDKKEREKPSSKKRQQVHFIKTRDSRKMSSKKANKFYNYRKLGIIITPDEYDSLYQKQHSCCAICGKHESDTHNGILHLDHCHKTGKVRGFLCQSCNHGIGLFKDNPNLLLKAYDYVIKTSLFLSDIA